MFAAFRPHELTQQFRSVDNPLFSKAPSKDYNYRAAAAFLDPSSRLYRVFEFLETHNRAAGTAVGGRIPGRININTIWDVDTFLALCDAQPSNAFTTDFVNSLFQNMIASRTPNGSPGPTDQPFMGMTTGYSDSKTNPMNSTFFRLAGSSPRSFGIPTPLFGVPQGTPIPAQQGASVSHPAQEFELMNKVFNNLTTRSNVFAVWLTVGFFEVVNPNVRPFMLGAEIGRAENRQIRHRMFAIVDRTNLSTLANFTQLAGSVLASSSPTPRPQAVQIANVTNATNSTLGGTTAPPYAIPWNIKVGSSLTIEDPINPESVVVTGIDVNRKQISAPFKYQHSRGTWVSSNDIPGPPPVFLSADTIQQPDPKNPKRFRVMLSQAQLTGAAAQRHLRRNSLVD